MEYSWEVRSLNLAYWFKLSLIGNLERGAILWSPFTLPRALLNKTYPSHFRRNVLASLVGAGVQGGSAPLLGG